MEPFRIHVADEVLDDLRLWLRHTRWPDQLPDIGWKQGTELNFTIATIHGSSEILVSYHPRALATK